MVLQVLHKEQQARHSQSKHDDKARNMGLAIVLHLGVLPKEEIKPEAERSAHSKKKGG